MLWVIQKTLAASSLVLSQLNKAADSVDHWLSPMTGNHGPLESTVQLRNQVLKQCVTLVQLTQPYLSPFLSNDRQFLGTSPKTLSGFRYLPGSKMELKLSFSFGHSDWLTLHYLLGNAKCLQELIKEYFLKDCQFLGSSWGALLATCMALELDVNLLSNLLEKISMTTQCLIGPIAQLSHILQQELNDILPQDISKVNGRLILSATHLFTGKSIQRNTFKDKNDLIQFLLGTIYIPVLCETPIQYNGMMLMEGRMSQGLLIQDALTITFSPVPGTANITPKRPLPSSLEEYFHHDPHSLALMASDGYKDCHDWLNKMVKRGFLTTLIFKRLP